MKFVSINGFNSDYITVKYGVPHGSVLTPVLFLIFMNDLNFAIKRRKKKQLDFDLNLKLCGKNL